MERHARRAGLTALLGALALVAASAVAAPGSGKAGFARPPQAVKAGGKVKITFAASGATDVEVAVLDAKGKVVRHLAAGLLGERAPAPLKAATLAQELEWDLRDDAGLPAGGGPFKIRVALGLRPRLHRIMGWSGQRLGGPCGLVAGHDGTVYAVTSGGLYAHRQTWLIRAFDRSGKYLRQVFPGPANLPPGKRKGWPRIRLDDGSEVPVVFHLLPRTTYPGAVLGGRVFPAVTRDGRLVVLTGSGHTAIKYPDFRGGRRLLILGTDGSVPENFLGPEVCPMIGGFGHVALSPDDKHVYATGFVSTGRKGKGPCNVVYRLALDASTALGTGASEPSRVFIGKMHAAGSGKAALRDPQGIATDAAGNIYVADYGNDRIAVFKPDGSWLDEIKVAHPDTVCVSRKTGAVYVMQIQKRLKPFTDGHWYTSAHNWRAVRVVKFGSLSDKTEKASFANPLKSKHGGGAFLTLDESGEGPVLWVTGLRYGGGPVLKVADKGGTLELLGSPISDLAGKDKARHLGFIGDVTVTGEKVITRHPAFGMHTNTSFVYSAETGRYVGTYVPRKPDGKNENMWTLLYGEMIAGGDGNLYVHARSNIVRRYDPQGRPLPFTGVEKGFLEGLWHGHTRGAGMFIDRAGTIYLPAATGNRKIEDMKVKVIDAGGKVVQDALIEVHNARLGGIAVDRAGSVYLGAQAVPKASRIPKWFAGRLPADSPNHHPSLDYKQYASIFKFGPAGGKIVADPKGGYVGRCQYKVRTVAVKGALWARRLGYVGSHGHELGCHCETTRFDLDGFGRLFAPDVFRFCVFVLDAAGNEIARFGSYGNMDSRGPGSPVPVPEIAFGWPLSVECAGGRVFVADVVNCRIVAVKFEHAASAECPVR